MARLCELEEMGCIRRVRDDVQCPISGETCTTWESVDAMPRLIERAVNPTRVELIRALCSHIEQVVPASLATSAPASAWLKRSAELLSMCEKYRGRKYV